MQTIIKPKAQWQNIHLAPQDMQGLRDFASCDGQSQVALFVGSAGTRKTLAAEVVAGQLNRNLMRVDLASIVSKYVGETEKNLDKLFRQAQCSDAVLLFDEADALFGKRTDVKDAHDRYSNMENASVSILLNKYRVAVIFSVRQIDSSIRTTFPRCSIISFFSSKSDDD